MKALHLYCLTGIIFLMISGAAAQDKKPVETPFTDSGNKLPGVINGKAIYEVFSQAINGSHLANKAANGFGSQSPVGKAWSQSKSMFDSKFIYTTDDKYFLDQGIFNGESCIRVYNSPALNQLIENRQIFSSGTSASSWYQTVSAENNSQKKGEFEAKLGKLAGYFTSGENLAKLENYLGENLFDQMMRTLSEENQHLITGAMIHEGTHALYVHKDAAAIEEAFKSGACPVQMNELRGYMAEILYHCNYYNQALNDLNSHLNDISNLLKSLEECRRQKPPDLTEAEKEKIEKIKAQIKAHIAMIRVRLREMETSARRMNFLMTDFIKNYVKPVTSTKKKEKANGEKLVNQIKELATLTDKFMKNVLSASADMENWLRALEGTLDEWNKFRDCKILIPPPKDTIKVETAKKIVKSFPKPPVAESQNLRNAGDKGLGYFSQAVPGGGIRQGTYYQAPEVRRFSVSAGMNASSLTMKELNDYFDYINTAYNGDLSHIRAGTGFNLGLDYNLSRHFSFGLQVETLASKMEGKHDLSEMYTSENSIQGILGNVGFRTNPVAGFMQFSADISAGNYFANYKESENDFVTEGKDNQFGWKAGAGINFHITPAIGIRLTGGYRNLQPDDYGVSFFLPAKPPVSLDYSGFYGEIRGVISF